MPRESSTLPPPPPDPIDAADEALARSRAAVARFRDADDFDEPTGQHDAHEVHVHIERTPRPVLPSVSDADIPKNHTLAGTIATLVAAATATLIAKLLGKL
jgi:hypothetical protein